MFTGIVEEIGTIRSIRRGAHSSALTIGADVVLGDLKVGDSVAVNGVCLTATALLDGAFTADVMHETLDRSSLGALSVGSHVNLERAMAADGRFGGHIVAGHVDGTGRIRGIEKDDNAVWYTIGAGDEILRYVVEKGSVAVDGISSIAFVIGGSLGLSEAVSSRADFKLSFSKMTFPHQMMRVILLEQIYRSFKIIRNETYHK